MKKKTEKKLVLAKETVIALDVNFEQVVGVDSHASCYTGCPTYTGQPTCATCGPTCTTNLC